MPSHGITAALKVGLLAAIGIALVALVRRAVDLALAGMLPAAATEAGASARFEVPVFAVIVLTGLIVVGWLARSRFEGLKPWPGLIAALVLVPGILGYEILHASGDRNSVAEIVVLAAVIAACWLVTRQTRPAFDAGSWEAKTRSVRAVQGLTLAQAQGKQRLSSYLLFFIPLVCLGLTVLASQAMAPIFAGIGLAFCLWGGWLEAWLSVLRA